MMAKTLQTAPDHPVGDSPAQAEALHAVASTGISLRLWRLYAQFWLVCLVFPLLFLVQTPPAPPRLVAAVAGLALYVIAYTWFMWPHPADRRPGVRPGSPTSALLFAGLVVLVVALSLSYGSALLWLFVGVSAVAGVALSPRSAFVVVMALTLLTLGLGIGFSGGLWQTDWLQLLPLVLLVRGLGLDLAGLTRLADALRELHRARAELAQQAIAEERLRLARDLHDLLGHTLSLITLKSELAGRLVDKDPARAAREIHEVEQEARRALREVREAVSGYRQPALRSELEGARQMLEAAGIHCAVEQAAGALAPAVDAVLAWTVREGVTNVIRHSRARVCAIRVLSDDVRATVEIVNDGYRASGRDAAATQAGSGLSGLAERVGAQGGQLEAGPFTVDGAPGFRLGVAIPLPVRGEGNQERG